MDVACSIVLPTNQVPQWQVELWDRDSKARDIGNLNVNFAVYSAG